MKFNFDTLNEKRVARCNDWLDGFIAAEIVALILLIGYCLAKTF